MSEFENKNHPEWEKESSLTSPSDRDREKRWLPEQAAPALSEQEVKDAMTSINNISFVNKFPRVDRTYADPPPPMQQIGLISFVPAKGATPNENGVFGFAKLRGNYNTEIEANQRAEFIIRNVDSYHQIYHTYVGRPFPITFSSDYSAQTDEIDIRKETTKAISSSIKEKKRDEQKTVDDIKEREEKLIEESKMDPDDVDPYEEYITLRVKKAQLTWTYLEHIKKMEEVKGIILKTRARLDEMDGEDPEFKEKYYEKYMKARRESGLNETAAESQDNFMKFLVEDVELPGIDDVDKA